MSRQRNPHGGTGAFGGSRRPQSQRHSGLPPDYLSQGYFDENGRIRRDVILDTAKEVARRIHRDGVSVRALRNFFNMVRKIEAFLNAGGNFEDALVEIRRLKPIAAYQGHRQQPPISDTVVQFINKNVLLAEKDEKHFRAFVSHFESVLAFFPRPRERR